MIRSPRFFFFAFWAAVTLVQGVCSSLQERNRMVREEVAKRVAGLDPAKIFLSGTHTHTAPVMDPGSFILPEEGVLPIEQYRAFFVVRLADAIAKAWNGRAPGSVTWGLGHAVVAYNRRAVYGIQMQARSKALQTFVVQLAGPGTYLPTERAVRGGSYSAIVQSNLVGPEGGQVLVDKTVAAIDAVFAPRE